MQVHGACHCGHVRFQATVDPSSATVCHCADCQALSGTAFRITVAAPRGSFILHSGNLTTYEKPADSGVVRALTFCPICGSSIYSTAKDDPKADIQIRTGILTERAALAPQRQIWRKSALAWVTNLQSVPFLDRQ